MTVGSLLAAVGALALIALGLALAWHLGLTPTAIAQDIGRLFGGSP